MRHNLLIWTITAAAFGVGAQEPQFEYALPELPVIQLCAVEQDSEIPVPFASISVEYADTIISSKTDEMGLLDFTPRSFPLTVTATGEGMKSSTYCIMEQPDGPLTILMASKQGDDIVGKFNSDLL